MAFGLWLPLTLFFAAAVFGLLESDTAWSLQYRWLIPWLAGAGGISLIFTLLSTKWAGRLLQSPAAEAPQPEIRIRADRGTATAVGSIGNIGEGAVVNIGTSHVPRPELPSHPKAQSDFAFVGTAIRTLQLNPDAHDGIDEHTNENGVVLPNVLVLRFSNLPPREGVATHSINIVAKMRFFSDNWSKHADVDYGVWVGSPSCTTDMDVGDTRELFCVAAIPPEQPGGQPELFTLRDLRSNQRLYDTSSDRLWVADINVTWFRHVEILLMDSKGHKGRWITTLRRSGSSWDQHEAYPPAHAPVLGR